MLIMKIMQILSFIITIGHGYVANLFLHVA